MVDAKTGSSGRSVNTITAQRMTSFYAYKPFTHQHVPEIDRNSRTLAMDQRAHLHDAFATRCVGIR